MFCFKITILPYLAVTSKEIDGRPMPIWQTMDIRCAGFTFVSNFDSGNLARVEEVSRNSVGKYYNINNKFGLLL